MKSNTKTAACLSDRIRLKTLAMAETARRLYLNGNRKDAAEIIRGNNGETSAMVAGQFLRLASDAGRSEFADAVRFLDSFADF